jgi:hypothetical protein
MHRCSYRHRIENIDGLIVRTVTAVWKDRTLDVYREDESGKQQVRNVYYNGIAGYCVEFPGDPLTYGGGKETLEDWKDPDPRWKYFRNSSRKCFKPEIDIILAKYPAFSYTLKKADPKEVSVGNILSLLSVWTRHPEVELLVAGGFWNIVWNRSFWKMTPEKQKTVRNFLLRHPGKDWCLRDILSMLANGIGEVTLLAWHEMEKHFFCGRRISFKTYRYFQKSKRNRDWCEFRQYGDLIDMLKSDFPERLKDDYWVHPADIKKTHDKLMKEIDAKRKAERMIQEARFRAERKAAMERKKAQPTAYEKAISGLKGMTCRYGTLRIFIPPSVSEIAMQARVLHQCLITADYVQKVIDRKCILVFIRENGKPVATAEILGGKKKRLGQFYGNELDRNNCNPPAKAYKGMDKWMNLFGAKKNRKEARRAA